MIALMQAFAEDDDTEFTNEVEEMVKRAEWRIMRELDLELFVDTDVSVTAQTARSMTLPTGVIQIEELWVSPTGTVVWAYVEQRSVSRMQEYAPDDATSGASKYWNQNGETTFIVTPTPAASQDIKLRVVKRPGGLSTTVANTWIGDNLEDLLLQACLIETHQFLKNKEGVEQAATNYTSLITPAKAEVERLVRKTYKNIRGQ
jgi:hypothetical protein